MAVTQADIDRLEASAQELEMQGYFERARGGDKRACSLFTRFAVYVTNPTGDPEDFGWLSKSPGEAQHDGFSVDAACFSASLSDRRNVIDIIVGAELPGARVEASDPKERRENNRWVKPQRLSDEDMKYLKAGGMPVPQPPPAVVLPPPRDEALDEMKRLDEYYKSPEGLQRPSGLSLEGKPDFEGIAAWYLDVYQRERMAGKSREEARAKYVSDIRHSDEWKAKHPGETP